MADTLTAEQRKRCMSENKGRDTKPELVFRKALWAEGLRYRLKSRLPGKPDIIFPGAKVAVFVDGCFWHGCPEHYSAPASNVEFWSNKINRNKERDIEVERKLRRDNWNVIRFWEHEIKQDMRACIQKVSNVVIQTGTVADKKH